MKRCVFMNTIIISLLMLFVFIRPVLSEASMINISDSEKQELLTTYAPLVYFHLYEEFYPSSVEWSLNYMVRKRRDSEDGKYCLETTEPLTEDNPGKVLPYYHGFDGEDGRPILDDAPVYAFWNERHYGRITMVDLVYFSYYPFNRGKANEFLEDDYGYGTWGNHVGDWEYIVVSFLISYSGTHQLMRPTYVEYSYHSYSKFLAWEAVEKFEGTQHPVVYSALGSHGNWPRAGHHVYEIVEYTAHAIFGFFGCEEYLEMADDCGKGRAWHTWISIEAFDYTNKSELPEWMSANYNDPNGGAIYRWGNERMYCVGDVDIIGVIPINLGEEVCVLEDGPTGPVDKGIWEKDTLVHVDSWHPGSYTRGDGSEEKPFRTIQEAMDVVSKLPYWMSMPILPAIVLVHDGVYRGGGTFRAGHPAVPAIAVVSENGPESCIIYCKGDNRGFTFVGGGVDSIVDGFTIWNGNAVYGGGIRCYKSSPTIANMIIKENRAKYGGGIDCTGSSPTIVNSIIMGNTADQGGGIYCIDSRPKIINTTIAGNETTHPHGYGGGLYGRIGGSLELTNTILWDNNPHEIHLESYQGKVTLTATHCDIRGGQEGIVGKETNIVNWDGSITADPLFFRGYYNLSVYSPCIGAGTSNGAPDRDYEGNPRPNPSGSNPDIGAYESSLADPLFISINLIYPNGGEVWRAGSTRKILWNTSGVFDHIRIVYSTDGGNTYPGVITDRTPQYPGVYEWNIPPGLESTTVRVKVIGESSSNQEIASDISDANFTITTSEVVVNVRSLEFDTIQKAIDIAMPGDTVQVANGTYRGPGNVNLDFKGKAITVKSRNGPEVCVIDCEGLDGVRGFYFHNGEGSDSVVDGFTVQNANANGDFTNGYGGGILCWGASPTIANMIITECKSSDLGGGICCAGSPTVINTIVTRNESGGAGGGISCYGGSPKIINTTITGNLSGKGIHFGNNTAAEITNTILWNNAPGEIQLNWGTPTFTCCDVRGGWSGNGTGNINKDPLFVDAANGDYHLSDYSPCIGAGTENDAPDRDIAGNPRPDPEGSKPDIGAYENSLDAPDEGLYITLTSPNGGEIWRSGSFRYITWDAPASFHQIHIVYSTDGGNTYPGAITSGTGYDGVYEWELPAMESTAVRVRVIAVDSDNTELASDSSDADFTITSSPILISVPTDFATIQAAIDVAIDGDIVQVADGVYAGPGNINLDFKGKAITVRSENGAENCIIDCEMIPLTRGFYFHSGEDLDSIVEGFTIQNGLAAECDPFYTADSVIENGGGILCNSASPTIRNNIIKGNVTSGSGGGILCENNSSPLIIGNTIAENAAHNGNGGGIACKNSSPIIDSNIIRGNSATQGVGGGIACQGSSSKIENNVIVDNSVQFLGPHAAGGGGGIYCADSSSIQSINNTITGNEIVESYEIRGGGVYCGLGSFLTVKNTILWDNSRYYGNILEQIYVHEEDSQINVSYSDIQGGWPGTGNINADPQFADPEHSNYHLSYFSPCIGAGTENGAPDGDIEGNPRPSPESSKPDMGAYENPLSAPGENLHITLESPNGGEMWRAGSLRNITWDSSVPFDHVRLIYSTDSGNTYPHTITSGVSDDGIYEWNIPDLEYSKVRVKVIAEDLSNTELASDVSDADFTITASPVLISVPADFVTIQAAIDAAMDGDTVQIADDTYTGAGNVNLTFRGKAITVRSENGPENCIIDCESMAIGFWFRMEEGLDSVLDGLTIRNGRAPEITYPDGGKYSFGGGIFCYSSSPTIANTVVTGSTAIIGGGIFCYGSSSPLITNSIVKGNSAGYGGGIVCYTVSYPAITNTEIVSNVAVYGGGVFCIYSATPTITNTTIAGNTANYGSGICCTHASAPSLTNTILWNNASEEIHLSDEGSIGLRYCDVRGGWPGVGNIQADPLFVDAANGDYHLSENSPCIGAGIITQDMPDKDIEGNQRPNPEGSNPDIGAYESEHGEVLSPTLVIQTTCPVDLEITDPMGNTINKGDTSAIPSAVYTEEDLDGDSDPDDKVTIGDPMVGYYLIAVEAEPGADPTDTYTLEVLCGGETETLANNIPIGSIPAEPYTFFCPMLNLPEGWNLISLPLQPADTDPGAVLSSIDGKYNSVWAYDTTTSWSIYAPGTPSDLSAMEPRQGYWIKMDEDGTLILEGTAPTTTGIHLEGPAWNLVGYCSCEYREPDTCMSQVVNDINSVWEFDPDTGWAIYKPGGVSDLTLMKPGYGYWVKADANCVWDVNAATMAAPSIAAKRRSSRLSTDRPVVPYVIWGSVEADGTLMTRESKCTVTLKLNDQVESSYQLGAESRFGDSYVLEIPADNNTQAELYVCVDNRTAKAIPVTPGEPGQIRRFDLSVQLPPKVSMLKQNYPNPFNPDTWIPYQLKEDASVMIKIYSSTGQLVRTLNLGHKPAGYYTAKEKAAYWDGRNEAGEPIASGIYFYSVQAGDYTAVKKMVIAR